MTFWFKKIALVIIHYNIDELLMYSWWVDDEVYLCWRTDQGEQNGQEEQSVDESDEDQCRQHVEKVTVGYKSETNRKLVNAIDIFTRKTKNFVLNWLFFFKFWRKKLKIWPWIDFFFKHFELQTKKFDLKLTFWGKFLRKNQSFDTILD